MNLLFLHRAQILLLFLGFSTQIFSQVKWIRATYRDDPSTTISIGWSGSSAMLYYDTIDHGTNFSAYAFSRPTDRTTNHKGNSHNFCRLSNLTPGTTYYFVLVYGGIPSSRFHFKTLSDDSADPVSFISGGDSRKDLSFLGIGDPPCWGNGCRETRRDLNSIIANIRPDFIAFTGDYIRNYDVIFVVDSEEDWTDWFNDWDFTIATDGRITPMIHSLGNHEDAVDLDLMFDVSNTDIYYATNFGGDLFRLYTLNSEPDACADIIQKNWFINDLQQYSAPSNTPYWKIVQYHQPMIPHAEYSSRTDLIDCWASYYSTYGVRLSCESHTHVMKTTFPMIYDAAAPNSYNKLVRNDTFGAVFIGDGAWGAPPRTAYAPIPDVTRDVEQTSGYFYININKNRIKINAIVPYPDSMANVPTLSDNDQGTALPAGVPLWRPGNGSEEIIIQNYNSVGTIKIKDEGKFRSSIHPNPASDWFEVRFKNKNALPLKIEIYDAHGKLCKTISDINGLNQMISTNELCQGVNILTIVYDKDIETHKIVIKR